MAVGLLLFRRRVLSLCDDIQGANPIRVASPTNKRFVILGANFRGENCASAVGLLLLRRRVLSLCDDSKVVNGDVSQVGAVLSRPMLEFAQGIA